MSKDKRGFGERSTYEAPIAPQAAQAARPLPRRVRSEYIKGKAECVYYIHVAGTGFDRLGSDRCLHKLKPYNREKRCAGSRHVKYQRPPGTLLASLALAPPPPRPIERQASSDSVRLFLPQPPIYHTGPRGGPCD